jgi:hypothetical protein
LFKDEDKERGDIYKSSAQNPEEKKLLECLGIDRSVM